MFRSSLSVICHRVPWIFGFIFELGYLWGSRTLAEAQTIFLLLLRILFQDKGILHEILMIFEMTTSLTIV